MSISGGNLWLLIFLVSLLVQGQLWRIIQPTDADLWMNRIFYLEEDLKHRPLIYTAGDSRGERYGGQPGMAVVTGALWARKMGASDMGSFTGMMAILVAGAAATAVTAGYLVSPRQRWWLVSGMMLLFNPLYWRGTPTDAVMAAWTAAVMMMIWAVIRSRESWRLMIGLGIGLGVGLITRTAFAVLLFSLLLAYLGWRQRQMTYKWWGLLAAMIATAYVLNPLLWDAPGQHLWLLLARSAAHAVPTSNWRWTIDVLSSKLPIILISLGLAAVIIRSKFENQVETRKWLAWLVVTTIAVSSILGQATQFAFRYLWPLIFMWEFLLPFEIWYLAERWLKNAPKLWLRHAPAITGTLLAGAYIGMTLMETVAAAR